MFFFFLFELLSRAGPAAVLAAAPRLALGAMIITLGGG
jgi:hypothetical protein